MRISDWSSDVCSSDLGLAADHQARNHPERGPGEDEYHEGARSIFPVAEPTSHCRSPVRRARGIWHERRQMSLGNCIPGMVERGEIDEARAKRMAALFDELSREYAKTMRSEEHTSELQSLLRISSAVVCLKQQKSPHPNINP